MCQKDSGRVSLVSVQRCDLIERNSAGINALIGSSGDCGGGGGDGGGQADRNTAAESVVDQCTLKAGKR